MLTIAVMSYGYGHLAAHCIESILGQTQLPSKIIFVDDGARDCHHLPKLYPKINFVLRDRNLGIIDNFNDILYKINTEYTMFLGADNWLRSDTIEMLSQYSTDIVTYDIVVTGEGKQDMFKRGHGHELSPLQGDFYWHRNGAHHGSMMYRTALAQRFGYKKNDLNSKFTEEDWNLFNKMKESGATISYHREALLYYRRHNSNFFKY